jgi:hypothetical protein
MIVLRRDVSLLLSEGHPHAPCYPLWRLDLEAGLATVRKDQDVALSSSLIQSAINACLDRDAGKDFTKTIKKLSHGQ